MLRSEPLTSKETKMNDAIILSIDRIFRRPTGLTGAYLPRRESPNLGNHSPKDFDGVHSGTKEANGRRIEDAYFSFEYPFQDRKILKALIQPICLCSLKPLFELVQIEAV
jgi:hypothetical protein